MICMSYELITAIVRFTAPALYNNHCTRKVIRVIEQGRNRQPRDDR